MKIIGLVNKDSGPGFHRILMPLIMAEDVDAYVTNNVSRDDFVNCDAVYYNRIISDDILELRKELGFKVIVDVDDYWKLDVDHISYDLYRKNNFEELQLKHIKEADLVTTTHERLAEEIGKHNKRVVVTPNAIPDHSYFKTQRTISSKIRVFWQGSITHSKDIELVKNPFKRLDKRFLMILSGYTNHPEWDRMVSFYTNGLKHSGSILPGVSPFEYFQGYQYADICIAPLRATRFNSLKSNLKVLEAAHMGLPVIASKVDPYLNLPVLYVERQTDWYKHLNDLANSTSYREKQGRSLKNFCDVHFNFNTINHTRLNAFNTLIYGPRK